MVSLNLRVLIADDDTGMRLVLKKVLSRVEGFELIGEAEDGNAAFCFSESLRPDIIFMDVEMPFLSGIECAKKVLDINPKTIIIFATAHDKYMSDAFELYAFDYLVKPFKLDRVNQTLERIRSLSSNLSEQPVKQIGTPNKALEKLVIKNKDGISFINMDEIILIQREDRSTAIYTTNERYITSDGLTELEERLDRSTFFRSHKSYIINLLMIHKIFPYGRWTYVVKLKNTDKDALLTHDRYEELQKLFER
ncbi:MAG: Sensory transduction protein LytR [Firmicutes bacterium ADurb.Bin419]|nr:MAG: Sensory transduction protein LytR [Firmicutes bacterium ADurb.Bin419]